MNIGWIILDSELMKNPHLLPHMTESIYRLLSALPIKPSEVSLSKISLWHQQGFFLYHFLSFFSLSLSVSVVGGERVKGGILGRRRCRWSPVMVFSSHSSFVWTVCLGPAGWLPCVEQHAWGFGCLFLASFLLLFNKEELNENMNFSNKR